MNIQDISNRLSCKKSCCNLQYSKSINLLQLMSIPVSTVCPPFSGTAIIAALSLTLPDNAVTNVNVGSRTTDIAVIIEYAAKRGATYQMGTVFILVTGSTTDFTWIYQDDDIGLTITTTLNINSIVMVCTVDASSVNDVEFDYVKEIITSIMATLHATLSDNATTDINVGAIATDHAVIIVYAATRGTLYQAGKITVLNEDNVNVDYNNDWFSDDIGITVAADISGANIRLNIAVDNSTADDVEFDYNITTILL